MSPIIHAGVGWLLGAKLPTRRDRVVATVAAVIPDVDGLTLLFGEDLYAEWHHKVAHGAAFAVVVVVAAALITRRASATIVAALAYHSHILCDLAGSGPGWPIWYWWPFDDASWLPSWQWDLASWQNAVFGAAVIALCLTCGVALGRTPIEVVSKRADAAVSTTLQARFRAKSQEPGAAG
jgi:inner membrane protein